MPIPIKREFTCSYCGNAWTTNKYRTATNKTPVGNSWKEFSTTCPNCHRAVTEYQRKGGVKDASSH